MPPVPILSGRAVANTFTKLGWEIVRQRGSHIILVRANHPATLSVPDHDEVARGTLRALIRRSGLTLEEFVAAS